MARAKKPEAPEVEPEIENDIEIEDDAPEEDDNYSWRLPTREEAWVMPLNEAMACVQMEFAEIKKRKRGQSGNQTYMYADLADVLDAIQPTLSRYRIEVRSETSFKELEYEEPAYSRRDQPVKKKGLYMFLTVSACKGTVTRSVELPVGPAFAEMKTMGSNITYTRRYAEQLLFNLSPDDDTDGTPEDRDPPRSRYDRDRDDRDRRDVGEFDQRDDYERRSDDRRRRDRDDYYDDRRQGDREGDRQDDTPYSERPSRNGRSGNGGKEGGIERETRRTQAFLDMFNQAVNSDSAASFWKLFKKDHEKEPYSDDAYNLVLDTYKKRYRHLKNQEEKQGDPLNIGKKDNRDDAPAPDVDVEEDHISPDEAIKRLEEALEEPNLTITRFHELLQEHQRLIDIASQFPPDKEQVDDMIEAVREHIERQEAESQDRDDLRERF